MKEQKASYQERRIHDEEIVVAMEDGRNAVARINDIGASVSHKIFGNGTITDQIHSSITVKFDFGEKRLLCPLHVLTVDNIKIIEMFDPYR